jgi:inward rectifier potassium channel
VPRFRLRQQPDAPRGIGLKSGWERDLYFRALTVPWWRFVAFTSVSYTLANAIFAGLYLLQPGAIAEARPGNFFDAFFFSVQTMATIGYGRLIPQTLYANILVTAEAWFGLLTLAIGTGLLFARFSRPTARVIFSQNAVIAPYNGVCTLSTRLANERQNQIVQVEVVLTLVRWETTLEGDTFRRFYDLKLARARSPVFNLTFQVMHPIEAGSPLAGESPASLAAAEAELLVAVTGYDQDMAQIVHTRHVYSADEILWNHTFRDIFRQSENGQRMIDFRFFHDTEPLPGESKP